MNCWKTAIGTYEKRCNTTGLFCRETDVTMQAYSSVKRYNPGLRAMAYAGFKLLAYLQQAGVSIYPFDERLHHQTATVFEVYPSDTWRKTGMKRSTNLKDICRKI